jgi:hypothetical protein
VEKQGAHFFGITISEAQAEAGVVVHVSSAAQSKFKVHNKIMHSQVCSLLFATAVRLLVVPVLSMTLSMAVFSLFKILGSFWLLFKVSIKLNQRFASQERFLIEVSKIQN